MRHNPTAGAIVIMLRSLKMHGMAQAVGELTEQGSPAFEAALPILSQLLKAETADREVRSTAYQLKAARFPAYRDLGGFDFASSEVNEALVRQLHRCGPSVGILSFLKPSREMSTLPFKVRGQEGAMPASGFGTATLHEAVCEQAVFDAIRAGYRLIDVRILGVSSLPCPTPCGASCRLPSSTTTRRPSAVAYSGPLPRASSHDLIFGSRQRSPSSHLRTMVQTRGCLSRGTQRTSKEKHRRQPESTSASSSSDLTMSTVRLVSLTSDSGASLTPVLLFTPCLSHADSQSMHGSGGLHGVLIPALL